MLSSNLKKIILGYSRKILCNPHRKLHENVNFFSSELLKNRKVLRISGENSSEFLQGLITNDIRLLKSGSESLYAMFLNNKGRVLFDSIIFRSSDSDTFLLECDSKCIEQLIKHLKVYKLRKKIDIESLEDAYSVWAIYDARQIQAALDCGKSALSNGCSSLNTASITSDNEIITLDPRVTALGYRVILEKDKTINNIAIDDKYKLLRLALGIGEGADELQIGQSFPLEFNCDFLNGVSFNKGCYIGQELTARTFHTGVVRKRLMPLIMETEHNELPLDTPIDDPEVPRKMPIGKLKGCHHKYGLGLMRVSETLESKSLKMLNIGVKAHVPHWWPLTDVQQKYSKINK